MIVQRARAVDNRIVRQWAAAGRGMRRVFRDVRGVGAEGNGWRLEESRSAPAERLPASASTRYLLLALRHNKGPGSTAGIVCGGDIVVFDAHELPSDACNGRKRSWTFCTRLLAIIFTWCLHVPCITRTRAMLA